MDFINKQTANNPKSRNLIWRIIQIICHIAFLMWFRFRTFHKERVENINGALLLVNHQSFLDPLLVGVGLTRPVSFLARENLFRVPVIGWILKNTYVMPVNRDAASTASMRECIRRVEAGYLVGLFPEGTRTDDGNIKTLKPGFISIARKIQQPIVPVGVAGAFEAFPKKSWFIWPFTIRVVYGQAISYEEYSPLLAKGKEDEFLKLITEKIAQCYQEAKSQR